MATERVARRSAKGPDVKLLLAIVAVGAASVAPRVAFADAMRCGSRLVTVGDPQEKVLQYCGEPSERSRTWIVRPPRFEAGGREYSFPGREDVPVDVWTYDFGPNRLVRQVRMVAGTVESIETLGHGTNR